MTRSRRGHHSNGIPAICPVLTFGIQGAMSREENQMHRFTTLSIYQSLTVGGALAPKLFVSLREGAWAAAIRFVLRTLVAARLKHARCLLAVPALFQTTSLSSDHTFLQQLRKVGKRSRSPTNVLIQFHPHLVDQTSAGNIHVKQAPCPNVHVWTFDKAQLKSGKLESRGKANSLRVNAGHCGWHLLYF